MRLTICQTNFFKNLLTDFMILYTLSTNQKEYSPK